MYPSFNVGEGDNDSSGSEDVELDKALLDVIAARDAREQKAVSNAVAAEPSFRPDPDSNDGPDIPETPDVLDAPEDPGSDSSEDEREPRNTGLFLSIFIASM